jgi:predicted ATPase
MEFFRRVDHVCGENVGETKWFRGNAMIEKSEDRFYGPADVTRSKNAEYTVQGFRSLQNFTICLKPGLNVFLGTNGSGKTNFIDFLDFITILVTKNTAAAVSAAGGVARVFSQEALKRKIPRITAKITGIADLTQHAMSAIRNPLFRFEYEIDIRYSKFHTAVYIANEKIKFKNLHRNEFAFDSDASVGSIELHRKSPIADDDVRWTVGPYLLSNAHRNPLRHYHSHRFQGRTPRQRSPQEIRKQSLARSPAVGPDESILIDRSVFPAFDAVRQALSRGRSFNLNPQLARAPDDISRIPSIDADGSGLSATIYQMQQARRSETRAPAYRRRFAKDSLDIIIGWTQIVIPDLTDISATADPHTGKYLVSLHVEGGVNGLKIPLQSASDGTLKWLCFVCLIVSQGAEYTFEEPENFLHPMMQQYFISLIRESIQSSDKDSRFILTTHSETIINQCNPDELILFKFHDGETISKTIENASALIEQINATGFGLGHFYSKNVLR